MIKTCKRCKEEIETTSNRQKYCTPCSVTEIKARAKERNNRPEVKARAKEYDNRPEVKAKKKELAQRPEAKARKKELAQRPEAKAKQKEYNNRPEAKAKQKAYKADQLRFKYEGEMLNIMKDTPDDKDM
jgi:hypothetical protein